MKHIFFLLGALALLSPIANLHGKEKTKHKAKETVKKAEKTNTTMNAYNYILKERMNYETTMFHLKNFLLRKEKDKAVMVLQKRLKYLRSSIGKVLIDQGFTEKEKEKLKTLNRLEVEWIKAKISEIES